MRDADYADLGRNDAGLGRAIRDPACRERSAEEARAALGEPGASHFGERESGEQTMNKTLVILVSVLAGCGGGGAGSSAQDTAMQVRWADNLSQVAPLQKAIEKCLTNS